MLELYALPVHYSLFALVTIITTISVSISQGFTGRSSLVAFNIQPSAESDIKSVLFYGSVLIEGTALFGVLIAFLLIQSSFSKIPTIYCSIAEIGIILAMCLTGLTLSLASSMLTNAACAAIARQPLFAKKITRLMLIFLTIMQTSLVFALITSFLIQTYAPAAATFFDSIRLLSAGLVVGLGNIGPIIGLATLAQAGIRAIGINRNSYEPISTSMIISQAFIEAPAIFAFVIALIILLISAATTLFGSLTILAASICMGLGTLGTSISAGRVTEALCDQLALNHTLYSTLSRASFLCLILIETCALYALITAMTLLMFI